MLALIPCIGPVVALLLGVPLSHLGPLTPFVAVFLAALFYQGSSLENTRTRTTVKQQRLQRSNGKQQPRSVFVFMR